MIFVQGKLCFTNLSFFEETTGKIDGGVADEVKVQFSKAFDQVLHHILLPKVWDPRCVWKRNLKLTLIGGKGLSSRGVSLTGSLQPIVHYFQEVLCGFPTMRTKYLFNLPDFFHYFPI